MSVLETERLVLRPFREGDEDDLFALWSDPEVMRFIGGGKVRTREGTGERLRRIMRHWREVGGNAVVFARRSLYGGPFADIGSLKPGDQILATTGQGKATYSVTQVDHVHSGTNDVIDDVGDDRLTLVTADPAWMPSQRLAVTAMLQTTPYGTPSGRPTQLNANETGTSGDNLAVKSLQEHSPVDVHGAVGASGHRFVNGLVSPRNPPCCAMTGSRVCPTDE